MLTTRAELMVVRNTVDVADFLDGRMPMAGDFILFSARHDVPRFVLEKAPDPAHAIKYEQDHVAFTLARAITESDDAMRWSS